MKYYYETMPRPDGKIELRRGRTVETGSDEWAANMLSRSDAPIFDEQEFHKKMDEFGVKVYARKPAVSEGVDADYVADILTRITTKTCGRPCQTLTWEASKEQASLIRLFFDVEGYQAD